MELIDKAAVVAEIERRLDELYNMLPDTSEVENGVITISDVCNTGKYTALESFKDFLDTLEVGEPSKDLEDEATKYAQDKYMPVQTAEAFRAGYNKCRQEMMNSAIVREVKVDTGGYPYIDATELYDYENDKPLAKAGDKVKVVFIKDK